MFHSRIKVLSNVFITARERGKLVRYVEGHNMWVSLGREYVARAVTPQAGWTHLDDRVIKFMGLGIGGVYGEDVADQLLTDYPGQHTYTDTDSLTPATLQRSVKLTGTSGRVSTDNTWLNAITLNGSTPSFSGTPAATVEYICTFSESDVNVLEDVTFASVPVSEVGLYLSDQTDDLTAAQVYDYDNTPSYIQTTRQQVVAYFPFEPISKTASVAIEVRWQLVF